MRKHTKNLFARHFHEIEEREQLNGGSCQCGRVRDRVLTPNMRTNMDELRDAVNNEPETENWTLGELIGQELKD